MLNLLPISKGGGMQNALSFLELLASDSQRRNHVQVLCRGESAIASFCNRNGLPAIVVRAGPGNRLRAEYGNLRSGGMDVCFTLFGAPSFGSAPSAVSVCGCAYSNLLYKEMDFWSYLRGISYLKKRFVDLLRKRALMLADFWVFETETLRRRAVETAGFPPDRVAVVRMAPSALVSPKAIDAAAMRQFQSRLPGGFKVLLLAGAHPNKRQMLLPLLADSLRARGVNDVVFVTTMAESDPYAQMVIAEMAKDSRSRYFKNIGPVPPEQCSALIQTCDAMMCISRLESFSNNFVEAWAMGKPLLVTDADWSRESCADAALYLDPTDANASAVTIENLIRNKQASETMMSRGREILASYHSPESKYAEYWAVLDMAKSRGKISRSERKRITW